MPSKCSKLTRNAFTPSLPKNILEDKIPLPCASYFEPNLRHNLAWMSRFCEEYDIQIAPHGKTTMSPEIFHLQLDHGAWGISLPSAQAVLTVSKWGVRNIILANQLVGKPNMEIVSKALGQLDNFMCLCDSAENVEALGTFFSNRKQRVKVLLEIALEGNGRSGVRSLKNVEKVAKALKKWRETISLVGVETYEGIHKEKEGVLNVLQWMKEVTNFLQKEETFEEKEIILSIGGSQWFDVATEELVKFREESSLEQKIQIIIRPGCYIVHDVGHYERNAAIRMMKENYVAREILKLPLQPAFKVWAYVLSIPEENKAIVGLGRKHASDIAGFPVPWLHFRPGDNKGSQPAPGLEDWKVVQMMDQHVIMEVSNRGRGLLKVGDVIAFDICHSCTTLNKWRRSYVINEDLEILDAFHAVF